MGRAVPDYVDRTRTALFTPIHPQDVSRDIRASVGTKNQRNERGRVSLRSKSNTRLTPVSSWSESKRQEMSSICVMNFRFACAVGYFFAVYSIGSPVSVTRCQKNANHTLRERFSKLWCLACQFFFVICQTDMLSLVLFMKPSQPAWEVSHASHGYPFDSLVAFPASSCTLNFWFQKSKFQFDQRAESTRTHVNRKDRLYAFNCRTLYSYSVQINKQFLM